MWSRGIAILIALQVSTTVTDVAADDGSSGGAAELSGEAKQAADLARVRFEQGDYNGALEALALAQQHSSSPRLFWNVAACERKLGRYARAIAAVRRYLATATGLTAEERGEAEAFLSAAYAYVSKVSMRVQPAGTEVILDGTPLGVAPFAVALPIDAGSHRVQFVKEGYRKVERVEEVVGGTEAVWVAELSPEKVVAVVPTLVPTLVPPEKPIQDVPPSRTGPLVLGSGGLVTAGLGGLFVGIAKAHYGNLDSSCAPRCAPARNGAYPTIENVGFVALVTGGALAVSAIVWWLLQGTP